MFFACTRLHRRAAWLLLCLACVLLPARAWAHAGMVHGGLGAATGHDARPCPMVASADLSQPTSAAVLVAHPMAGHGLQSAQSTDSGHSGQAAQNAVACSLCAFCHGVGGLVRPGLPALGQALAQSSAPVWAGSVPLGIFLAGPFKPPRG